MHIHSIYKKNETPKAKLLKLVIQDYIEEYNKKIEKNEKLPTYDKWLEYSKTLQKALYHIGVISDESIDIALDHYLFRLGYRKFQIKVILNAPELYERYRSNRS